MYHTSYFASCHIFYLLVKEQTVYVGPIQDKTFLKQSLSRVYQMCKNNLNRYFHYLHCIFMTYFVTVTPIQPKDTKGSVTE